MSFFFFPLFYDGGRLRRQPLSQRVLDHCRFVCTHDVEEARIASPQTELHQSFCDQVAFNFGDALRAVHENPADSVLLPSSTAVAAGALLASEGVAAVTAAITPTVFRDRPREGIALIAEATAAGGCYDALEEARASGREANVGGFTVRLLRVVLQSPTLLHRLLKAKPTDFSRDDAASLVTVGLSSLRVASCWAVPYCLEALCFWAVPFHVFLHIVLLCICCLNSKIRTRIRCQLLGIDH